MASVQQAVESTVMGATKTVEEQLDAEIERLDNLDSDDLEKLREVSSVEDTCVRRYSELCYRCLLLQTWRAFIFYGYIVNRSCE